jgi:predicted nucleotidyltransferase component of viral defense system
MRMPEMGAPRCHEDPDLFRAAIAFTSARTGFASRLVEKDYFCTIVLFHLAAVEGLVFKGGTCLAKVYAGFYRLSEDLDLVIPTPIDATRGRRSARAAGVKEAIAEISKRWPVLHVVEPLRGANASSQYLATLAYDSVLAGAQEPIKIEVALREPLSCEPIIGAATTVLLDPVTDLPLVAPVEFACIGLQEALAEKMRAALTRREVAIRDFFDLDHAVQVLGHDPASAKQLEMVRAKLAVPGNPPVDVSPGRLAALRAQLRSRLQPVLRQRDLASFDLERAIQAVSHVAAALSESR